MNSDGKEQAPHNRIDGLVRRRINVLFMSMITTHFEVIKLLLWWHYSIELSISSCIKVAFEKRGIICQSRILVLSLTYIHSFENFRKMSLVRDGALFVRLYVEITHEP